jgi:hypothetical protein
MRTNLEYLMACTIIAGISLWLFLVFRAIILAFA